MAETGYQLDIDTARRYEQTQIPTAMRPIAEMMFKHVSLRDGDRVLDVACGTGIVTRVITEQFEHVGSIVGVDLNPNMLEVARENAPTTHIPLEWHEGNVCELPFPDGSFDVVVSSHGLQFIPDKVAALREIRRVLTPSGRLAFTVWGEPNPYWAAMIETLARHISEDTATTVRAPFVLGDAELVRNLVAKAGFHGIEMQRLVLMRRMLSSALQTATAQPYGSDVAAASEETRAAIEQDVRAAMTSYDEVNGFFVVPTESHLVQARVS